MHQQRTAIHRLRKFFFLLLLSFVFAGGAFAAEKIGAIAAIVGKVSIERDGKTIKVKPGSAVYENDLILTGSSSRAQVLLMDQTAINIGQKAELVLDKFVFNSDEDEVAIKVTKGTFRFISGKVATKTPEKVNVETPVATIGVRGTEFVGQIDAANSTVALLNGRIEVANDISTQFVTNPGFGVTIDTAGVISPPVKIPQAELEAVLNSVSTDRDALEQEEIEAGPEPDEAGPNSDDEGGPGPDDEGGPGPDDEGGPGPDGEPGPGPDGEPGPGPDGEPGPGPDGEPGPGPDGEFGPGPDGEPGPGPDGEF
ncbi:MAG: FecR domain-containing protein, partial [Betaproteobacteria bacterium]|nr:FecR domain-containing protein [Betaproteobacteria bacterium]